MPSVSAIQLSGIVAGIIFGFAGFTVALLGYRHQRLVEQRAMAADERAKQALVLAETVSALQAEGLSKAWLTVTGSMGEIVDSGMRVAFIVLNSGHAPAEDVEFWAVRGDSDHPTMERFEELTLAPVGPNGGSIAFYAFVTTAWGMAHVKIVWSDMRPGRQEQAQSVLLQH
jgi:hypothetical protein